MANSLFHNAFPDLPWQALLERAANRGDHDGYQGNVTPQEAASLLAAHAKAYLIDVRTHAETNWVGGVPLAIEIEWLHYPDMSLNAHFVDELQKNVPIADPVLLFLCRSGVRSASAARAAAAAGYDHCYNILDGFEGPIDASGHRGTLGGWRKVGLPWRQT